MTNDEIFKQIVDYYLSSRDFNGLPVRTFDVPKEKLLPEIKKLINAGDISLAFGDNHPNPYVKCLKPWAKEKQIEKLMGSDDITHIVAYPEGERLSKAVKPQRYRGKPYRKIVALGRPTLDCAFFKLDVLERYRNDPRYSYRFNDIVGSIYARLEGMGKEEVFIQSVGFAYDEKMNRAVCAFYTDLMDLNSDQQQYWKQYELGTEYSPHPEFIRSQIYGHFPERASLPEAFTAELKALIAITEECYGKKLFKKDYYDHSRPKELAFLIRPTAKELAIFVHTLDKLLSENINKKFFNGLVPLEFEETRKDGKIVVTNKGSLTLLEEYVRQWFKPKYTKPMDEMFETFKSIRSQRTNPAHRIEEDEFNMKFFSEQRKLFIKAYGALRTLRLIFQNHPKADRKVVPNWLYEGNINTY